MIRKIDGSSMGRSNLGWLNSQFHFSFAEYYNPENIQFGELRVINDDLINPKTGFDTHPHRDMEIVSYVVDGELTHADSMGNERSVRRGEVQYMSAGTGVFHSEHNYGDELLRLLQIWILPDAKGYEPNYGDFNFKWADRENKLLQIVSGKEGSAEIKVNQDMNIYVTELDKEGKFKFNVDENRQVYVVQIEGSSLINGEKLDMRDALESVEEDLEITAIEKSHIMFLEMKKS